VIARAQPARLFRPGLLDRVGVLVAGADEPSSDAEAGRSRERSGDGDERAVAADAVAAACAALDARVWRRREQLPDPVSLDVLVVDAAGLFRGALADARSAGASPPAAMPDAASREALRRSLGLAWEITRAVADEALIAPGRAGRIVYLAPAAAGAGGASSELVHADAARAALENLARTLSIEWARYGITTATIAMRDADADAAADAATLVAYLCSPAGAYFSGCVFELGRR